MLPLIYTNSGALALFVAACLVWNVPEVVGAVRQFVRAPRAEATVQDHGSLAALIGLQWAGLALNFLLAAILPAAAINWQRTPLFLLGIALMLLGVVLRWYAILTLGAYFTRTVAVSDEQPVVRRGPYHVIRHPSYSGTLLTMLGVGLAVTNWASMTVLLICVLAGHLYRVSIEERALVQALGKPYADYMRQTKRFIPWVY